MKKITLFFTLAILLILAGISSACNKDTKKAYSTKEGRFDVNETEFVKMYFSPENGFINSPVELIIENHTEGVLSYGHAFSFEYFDKGNWTELPLDLNFPDNLLGLLAGETSKGQFNLSLIEEYNNGKKGKYRYVKRFDFFYDCPLDVTVFTLYTEFEVR